MRKLRSYAALTWSAVALVLMNGCAQRHGARTAFTSPIHQEASERSGPLDSKGRVTAGDWERLDALVQQDPQLLITLQNGARTKGSLQASTPESVTLADRKGAQSSIPKNEIRKVVLFHNKDDRPLNGTLIGLASGAGGGAALGYALSVGLDITTAVTMPFFGGVGAGVGALIGYLIDKSMVRKEVIYEAPWTESCCAPLRAAASSAQR